MHQIIIVNKFADAYYKDFIVSFKDSFACITRLNYEIKKLSINLILEFQLLRLNDFVLNERKSL